MARYEINGAQYELPDDTTPEQLNGIVAQLGGAQADAASASSSPSTDNSSVAGEAAKGLDQGLNSAAYSLFARPGQMLTSALHRLFPNNFDDPSAEIASQEAAMRAAQQKDAPAVQSVTDINSPGSAAKYAAHTLGGAAPMLAAAAAGGVPGAAVIGGATGADQTYRDTGSVPATIASGALNAAAAAAPVPFMRGGSGVVSGMIRGAAGATALSPLTAAAQTVPSAIASGDPSQAIPSGAQLADAAAGGALIGAAGGAALHGEAPAKAPVADPQAGPRQRLAQRISDEAEGTGSDLNNATYGAAKGSEQVLENVHNSLSEEIKGLATVLKPEIDPRAAVTIDDLIERSAISASLRDARNKRKSTVSETDFARLQQYVGHIAEGQQLIDAMRQSNELTELFRQGLKGGVSQYTDALNPIARGGGKENTPLLGAIDHPLMHMAGTAAGFVANPGITAAQLGAFGAGRAIDAVTGNRSRVARFVNDNIDNQATPVRTDGLPSILHEQEVRRQADAAERQANQEAIERGAQMRATRRAADDPGLQGFDASIYQQTGLRPYEVNRGVMQLFREGRITGPELNAVINDPESLMTGNRGNGIMDMLNDLARKGQIARDADWSPPSSVPESASAGSSRTQSAYEAQARGNQDRATAAQARVAASGFEDEHKQIISQAISRIAKTNNRLDARNIQHDMLNVLPPELHGYATQETSPLISQIRHATREAAEKARGEPLQTEAVKRDSRGRPLQRERLNLDNTDKLTDAFSAAVPRGDAGDTGNAVSRLRAQLYKAKAGIRKPGYDGAVEPSEDYLKRVADFHDKAIHDPSNPKVKASYGALIRETEEQYKSLGDLKVETWRGKGEPYRNSADMMRDVAQNGHLWFLPTDSAFGEGAGVSHPMLRDTGLKTVDGHPLVANDIFRIVHDIFGHTQHGFSFGPKGEYNAFREHAQMYSDKALPALAAETLAQNAWVNFGPHMRRGDGSIPAKGEADFVPPAKRKFSDQKAYAFPHELLSDDPRRDPSEAFDSTNESMAQSLLRQKIGEIDSSVNPSFQSLLANSIPEGADVASKKDFYSSVTGFKGIAPFLTHEERLALTRKSAQSLVDIFKTLPSADEMASVAFSGRAKRGWYANSAKAIQHIFGAEDAPRFTALLASLSPQCSVETNLNNALNMWAAWIEAGRPRDLNEIHRIYADTVGEDSLRMESWLRNTQRTLSSEDPHVDISGPKVSSFMKNLLGHVNEVTNDTWMANYGGIDPQTFKASRKKGDEDQFGSFGTKNGGYLAMSALTRKAAQVLTERTGQPWSPAEVQETVWSWAKALYEKADSAKETRTPSEIVAQGDLSHDEINSVPDFAKLFVKEFYSRILGDAGYGDKVGTLQEAVPGSASRNVGNDAGAPATSAEGAGIDPTAFRDHLASAADRLTKLYAGGKSADLAGPDAADVAGRGALVSSHPSFNEALRAANDAGGILKGYVVHPDKATGQSHVYKLPPKEKLERPSAPLPALQQAIDPEGRQLAAHFIAGVENPDGTMNALTEPQIRTLGKTIARVIEGVHPSTISGANGMYDKGNNTISVAKGLGLNHTRVLAHETGHAIEHLADVAQTLGGEEKRNPEKALKIVKELMDVSKLERPSLWKDDKELEDHFERPAGVMKSYRNRLDELLADGFAHYLLRPRSMKKVAPNAAKFMRDLVNPSKIGKVIALTSLAGLALPQILGSALTKQDNNT